MRNWREFFMKRQVAKVVMIIMQFIFYFVVNELFDVPDRIMYNTFFIYINSAMTYFEQRMHPFRDQGYIVGEMNCFNDTLP